MSAIGEGIPDEETFGEEKGPPATLAEKLAAFAALTREEKGRLLSYARWLAKAFTGRVNAADADDLYQEGLVRALKTRNWHPQAVDFAGFVLGSIRSTGEQWYSGASVGEPGSRKPRFTELPDEIVSPMRHDKQIEDAITIEKMREALKGRPYAVEILDLKGEGLSAKEIQEQLGIPANVHAATVKWIDRTLRQEGFRQ